MRPPRRASSRQSTDQAKDFDRPTGKVRLSSSSQWLIGSIASPEIRGRKLPSNRQVLQCHYHHRKLLGKAISETWGCVSEKVLLFWRAADLTAQSRQVVVGRIERLVDEYKRLKRASRGRGYCDPVQEVLLYEFKEKLDDLFDVGHDAALQLSAREEDRLFLAAQRERGRRGHLQRFVDSGVETTKLTTRRERDQSDDDGEEDEIVIVDDWYELDAPDYT